MSGKNSLTTLKFDQQLLIKIFKFVAFAFVLRKVASFVLKGLVKKQSPRIRQQGQQQQIVSIEEDEQVILKESVLTAPSSVESSTPGSRDEKNSETSDSSEDIFNSSVSFVQLAKTPSEMESVEVLDGKTAAAYAAYAFSELAFVYPVTQSGYIGQVIGEWSTHGGKNAFAESVKFSKMETKPGAGGALHGALAGGAVATALTSSEAIPLMTPSLSKIAHARLPTVIHVQTRATDSETFSSFIDHSSVLSSSNSGSVLISSSSVQEVHDLAIASHLVAFETNLPVVHFFDGVRITSESSPVSLSDYSQLSLLLDRSLIEVHRQRSSFSQDLGKKIPTDKVVSQISSTFANLSKFLGRTYKPFDYIGDSHAQTVIITLSAGSQSIEDAINYSIRAGQKVGLLKIRLYRPWSASHFLSVLPKTVNSIIVIDQIDSSLEFTPLYQDVVATLQSSTLFNQKTTLISATLASSLTEILPSLIQSLFKFVSTSPLSSRSVVLGAQDNSILPSISNNIDNLMSASNTIQCSIWDVEQTHSQTAYQSILNTVGKNSTGTSIQGFSTHAAYGNQGSIVNYQIRLGDSSSFAPFSLTSSDFVAVHDSSVLSQFDVLEIANKNSIFLLNSRWTSLEDLQANLPTQVKKQIASKNLVFYPIDASSLAPKFGLDPNDSVSITAVLQTIFFKLIKLDQALYWHQHILQLQQNDKKNSKIINNEPVLITLDLLQSALSIALKPLVIPSEWNDLTLTEEEKYQLENNLSTGSIITSNDNNSAQIENSSITTKKWHQAAWSVMFPEALETEKVLRPDAHHSYLVTLTENRRLTPEDYDRYVFHLEFDTQGTGLKYEIGDALGVYGHNDEKHVGEFLTYYGLNPQEIVCFYNSNTQQVEQRTVEQIFTQYLDIFGRPSKRFYQSLSELTKDSEQKQKLEFLISSEGSAEFKKRVAATVTFADILKEFTSARPTLAQLIQLVDPIKPRHYSIASSMKMHPNSVHLLVVLVDWVTPSGEKRYGQCTRYLSSLSPGSKVTVSVKPSVMKLPPLDSQPVIMAGLGTGMAPFRAFIEERAVAKREGKKVGPMVLYFGSRHRVMEYLYGEELEAYHHEGLLTHLRLAFSRDQKEKVYIQNKIAEDDQIIHDYLLKQEGHFYLCGPTWPAGDVRDAIASSFSKVGGMSQKQALKTINDLKDAEKYILEVY